MKKIFFLSLICFLASCKHKSNTENIQNKTNSKPVLDSVSIINDTIKNTKEISDTSFNVNALLDSTINSLEKNIIPTETFIDSKSEPYVPVSVITSKIKNTEIKLGLIAIRESNDLVDADIFLYKIIGKKWVLQQKFKSQMYFWSDFELKDVNFDNIPELFFSGSMHASRSIFEYFAFNYDSKTENINPLLISIMSTECLLFDYKNKIITSYTDGGNMFQTMTTSKWENNELVNIKSYTVSELNSKYELTISNYITNKESKRIISSKEADKYWKDCY